jgi:hypothetical protein
VALEPVENLNGNIFAGGASPGELRNVLVQVSMVVTINDSMSDFSVQIINRTNHASPRVWNSAHCDLQHIVMTVTSGIVALTE